MPRLLLFGMCQKAIIDRQDGTVSMISIINRLQIKVSSQDVIPADASGPFQWAIVASWFQQAEDADKTFQPKIEIILPNGKTEASFEGEPFVLQQRTIHSVISGMGFPIGQEGECVVRLFLREVGTDNWVSMNDYPFQVVHLRSESETEE